MNAYEMAKILIALSEGRSVISRQAPHYRIMDNFLLCYRIATGHAYYDMDGVPAKMGGAYTWQCPACGFKMAHVSAPHYKHGDESEPVCGQTLPEATK